MRIVSVVVFVFGILLALAGSAGCKPGEEALTPNNSQSCSDTNLEPVAAPQALSPLSGSEAAAEKPATLASLEAAKLTQELLSLAERYQGADSATRAGLKKEIGDLARLRAASLNELLRKDPSHFFPVARPDQLSQLSGTTECLERSERRRGSIEVLYALGEGKELGPIHLLTDSAGNRFSLKFTGKTPELRTGDKADVSGVVVPCATEAASGNGIDDSAELMALESETDLTIVETAAISGTVGEQTVGVILLNFQDSTSTGYTTTQSQSVVFDKTHRFWQENSFGKTWIAGQTFGPYTIPISKSGCDSGAIESYAKIAAADAGVDLSPYKRLMFVFPSNGCSWLGLGTIGGVPSKAWVNGSFVLHTVAHELGHNLGLYHANYQDCGTGASIGTSCTNIEYGDTTDVMGNHLAGHYNAFQKERLGWLGAASMPAITTVTASGEYFVEPFETNAMNPKALKILKSTTSSGAKTSYYVEYRQGLGFDSVLSSSSNYNLTSGVVIHTGSTSTANSSYLLNMNPQLGSRYKSALTLGQTFTDPTAGVAITVSSLSSAGATVSVVLNGVPSCKRSAPTMTLSPSASDFVEAGTEVAYTLSLKNNDATDCQPANFGLQAVAPSGFQSSFDQNSLTLSPGQSASTTLRVRSGSAQPGGSYSIQAIAANSSAPSSTTSAAVTYLVASPSLLNVVASVAQASYADGQTVHIPIAVSLSSGAAVIADYTLTLRGPDGAVMRWTGTVSSSQPVTHALRVSPCTLSGRYEVNVVARAGSSEAASAAAFLVD